MDLHGEVLTLRMAKRRTIVNTTFTVPRLRAVLSSLLVPPRVSVGRAAYR